MSLKSTEVDILLDIQDKLAHQPGVFPLARGLSHFGEHALGWIVLSGSGALIDAPRRRKWIGLGVAAFGAHAASVVIKRIVRRPRPHDERIIVGVKTPSQLSFPSSHATSTAAAMVALARLSGSPTPLLGIALMMASRMVLGVHYPTDTLAGAALGALTAEAVTAIERKSA